jgi:phenylalanyl-tRNA synthetase beta chain
LQAIERATQLLLQIVGGNAGPVMACEHKMPAKKSVKLEIDNVYRLLGMTMNKDDIINIFNRLGMILQSSTETSLVFLIPSYRFDISIEADLIEELARVYGYDHLPVTKPLVRMNLSPSPESSVSPERLRERLVTLGYQQVITYSFVEPSLMTMLRPDLQPVPLQNPISAEMAVMRTSLWAGLIQTLLYNVNRQKTRVRLFETGQIFLPSGNLINQPDMLGGLIYGSRLPADWSQGRDTADFYDAKGDLETILSLSGEHDKFTFEAQKHPALHNGQCARILKSGLPVGWIGALSPVLQRALDLNDKTFLLEIELAAVLSARKPAFKALSRFPEVSRDLAVLVDRHIPAQAIRSELQALAGEHLTSLRIFDVYQGDAIGSEKKSMALGLTWQHPSRTLGDDDINSIIERCVKGLEVKFNAKLRN